MSKIRLYININTDLTQVAGDKHYELSNLPTTFGIGNVLQVVTDRKLAIDSGDYNPETGTYYTMILGGDGVVDYYVSDVVSQSDYYPFGMLLLGRNSSDDSYRYGFNRMEMDDEVSGDGNSYDFGARFYNPRVGRWSSRYPAEAKYTAQSPYAFSLNSPNLYKDPNGKDAIVTVVTDGDKTTITFSSTIYLTGEGMTEEYLGALAEYKKRLLTDPVYSVTDDNGHTTIVKIDINFVNAESNSPDVHIPDAIADKKEELKDPTNLTIVKLKANNDQENGSGSNQFLDNGDNYIIVTKTPPSGSIMSYPYASRADVQYFDDAEMRAYHTLHESLHLVLGLSDRYNESTLKPFEGYAFDIMSTANSFKLDMGFSLNNQHIINIVNGVKNDLEQPRYLLPGGGDGQYQMYDFLNTFNPETEKGQKLDDSDEELQQQKRDADDGTNSGNEVEDSDD